MIREKQIIKEAESLIDPYEMFIDWEYERGLKEGFVKGAKWADDTMIDKACEWLWEHFYNHPHIKSFVCTESFGDSEEMIKCFKKAMEE